MKTQIFDQFKAFVVGNQKSEVGNKHTNGLRYSCDQCEYAAAEKNAPKTHYAEYTQVERALKINS